MRDAPTGNGSSGNEPASGGPREHDRRLRPTTPGAITLWAVVGLVGGWLLHPLSDRVMDRAPFVTWTHALALFLIAALLGWAARTTHRVLHVRRERLPAHHAVNRLVLARAAALVGALAAGGYVGYAVSWLGVAAENASGYVLRAGVAGVAGISVVVTALLLERACRVHSDSEPS
ncbi:DUF3180 family protein [Nocardioides sp.]|uniref:DUF3180 family protein n=1 Tax=Nocardioides sp. TaxID=35761 RepID=UPI003566F260